MLLSAGHQDAWRPVWALACCMGIFCGLLSILVQLSIYCQQGLRDSLLICATPLPVLPYKGLHRVANGSFAYGLRSLGAFVPSSCGTPAYDVSIRKRMVFIGDLSFTAPASLTQETACNGPFPFWISRPESVWAFPYKKYCFFHSMMTYWCHYTLNSARAAY